MKLHNFAFGANERLYSVLTPFSEASSDQDIDFPLMDTDNSHLILQPHGIVSR